MELVVNEWLPEYLRGDAPAIANKMAIDFLNRLMQSNHTLIVKAPSPFTVKIYSYQKIFSGYPEASRNFGGLHNIVFRNSLKTKIVYGQEILPIPEQTHNLLHTPGTNFNSDYYLFETAHLTESKIIITTDVALRNFMSVDTHFNIILLDDFLRDY